MVTLWATITLTPTYTQHKIEGLSSMVFSSHTRREGTAQKHAGPGAGPWNAHAHAGGCAR